MSSLLPRTAWTATARPSGLTAFVAAAVSGMALHWPGTTGVIGDPGSKSIAGRLDGYRRYHVTPEPRGHGWRDIAYSVAVDQAGRVWDLRGLDVRSAANGTAELNRVWLGVLLLLGPGEQPTAQMVAALRWLRNSLVLPRYPRAVKVVGHRDIRPEPTDCPGPAVTALIRSGAITKTPAKTPMPPPPGHQYTLRRYLSLGCTGADVEQLQRRLNRDLPDIRVDGDFGPITERTVRVWQSSHGLTADGDVGPKTAGKLGWAIVLRRRAA
jgi:hypothetical protein